MEIRFYGHACISIQTERTILLIDPYIKGNKKAKDVNIDSLKADFILITHAHEDHIQDVEFIAGNTGAIIISNYEIASFYEAKGFKVHAMNIGGKREFSFGAIKLVNAVHTSSFPGGEYGGQPGGFVISTNGRNIYVAGDTALTYDMKLIPMQVILDLIVLPIGDNYTMGIEDAILASDFLECNNVLGYHYDTFDDIKIDHAEAKKKFMGKGKLLNLLRVGEGMDLA